MDQLIKKLFFPKKIQIVGVSINEESTTFELLVLKKKGEQVSIIEQHSHKNAETLLKSVDVKLPVILHIDGKGVLNKKVDLDIEQDLQWYKNFDSKKLDFFQYKNGNELFVSITKNETISKYIELFKSNNIKIIDVFLGSFCAIPVKSFINDNDLITTFYNLQFEEDRIVSFNRNVELKNKEYIIGNEKLNSASVALFGSFLIHWLQQEEFERTIFVNESEINEVFYEYAFKKFGIFTLLFFLVTLLGSYVGVLYYSNINSDLNYQCQYSKETISKLETIEKLKKEKLEILNETGLVSSKYLTNYSYDILKSIPNSIQINELNINPAEKEIKEAKKILFENKKIQLKGLAKEEFLFNQWTSELKKLDWVKKSEILTVKRNKQGQLEFEIKISIKDV